MRIAAAGLATLALGIAIPSPAQVVRWSGTAGGPGGTAATLGDGHFITDSVAADSSGNVFVAGSASNGSNTDMLAAKLDAATGAVVWEKTFAGAGNGNDSAAGVAVDGSGNAIVAGTTAGTTADITVIKYAAADGSVLWQRTIDSGRDDAAYFVSVDASGNAFVGAETINASGDRDVRSLKLSGTDGSTLWDKTYDSGGDDFISDLALDPAGDLVVLALTVNAAGNDDIVVLKYAGTNGSVAWQRTWDGGMNDDGYGLAFDASRNVFVAGSTQTASGIDFLTLDLDAASGSVLWKQAYDGGSDDIGEAVAVDGAGNAFVTGQSKNSAGRFVFRTIKYPAGGGAPAWIETYDGGAGDFAYQVLADANGNAIVTGSTTVSGQRDWLTIAYAGADGSTLYRHSYAGSAGQDDQAYGSVALADAVITAGTGIELGKPRSIRVEKLANAASSTTAPSQSAEATVISHFYQAILRRAPDASGESYWESQAAQMAAAGASVNETWYAMAKAFFFSAEYASLGRDDAGFVTDLYNAFFDRAPDAGGLAYWSGLLASGMPRDVVLATFMFSPEFTTYLQGVVGNTTARAEVTTVMDFYRGLLSRLPDGAGFAYWVGRFRAAQCQGAGAVYAQADAISASFADGAEYAARGRTNAQYVGDLYNAFLRRGGDAQGVQFWISRLDSGAASRDEVRRSFIATPEFSSRVSAIVAQGCMP